MNNILSRKTLKGVETWNSIARAIREIAEVLVVIKKNIEAKQKNMSFRPSILSFFFCLYRGFGCNAYLNPVRAAVDSAGIAQKLDWNGAQTPCQTRKIAQKKADIWGMYYIATGTIYLVIPSITYCNISYIRRLHHITYIYILVIS